MLQLLHEEQLQHALIRVQVCQLEQLPLQDVVIPDAKDIYGTLKWSWGDGDDNRMAGPLLFIALIPITNIPGVQQFIVSFLDFNLLRLKFLN